MTANLPNGMRRKLVLQTDQAEDAELIQSLLDWMQSAGADFTNTFRDLSDGPPDQPTRPTVRSPPRRLGMIQETHERIAQSTGAEEETFGRMSGLVRRPAHNTGDQPTTRTCAERAGFIPCVWSGRANLRKVLNSFLRVLANQNSKRGVNYCSRRNL